MLFAARIDKKLVRNSVRSNDFIIELLVNKSLYIFSDVDMIIVTHQISMLCSIGKIFCVSAQLFLPRFSGLFFLVVNEGFGTGNLYKA